jgi:hypothetical protein
MIFERLEELEVEFDQDLAALLQFSGLKILKSWQH